ncbi:Rrf2 family transcriptional regulator [Halorutilales archaeon Cl-col2-1]
MAEIDLSSSQKQILSALVNLFREKEDVVKGEEIAEMVGRNPGTIRNQMQSLKALQLVEGIPGPKGGYKPTANAYESLDMELMEEEAAVPLLKNGDPVESANVAEIDLTSVHHPSLCRAEIHVQGSVHDFHEGDEIEVGPTPISGLVIDGVVDGKDETNNIVICKIEEMSTQEGAAKKKQS